MLRLLLTSILFLAPVSSLFSQNNIEFGKNHLLFFDDIHKEPVLVVNDSILYHGNNFSIQTKTAGLGNSNLGLDNPYCYSLVANGTFLVSNGCGPVVSYEDYTFTRVDNSFPQRNQHYAIPFTYKDEMYLFGGYGLFTHKNIITKYNMNIGEWTQVQTNSEELPKPRFKAFGLQKKDMLYIFGGYTQNPNKVQEQVKVPDGLVWKLYLPKMKWEIAGTYNTALFGKNPYRSFQANGKLYIVHEKIYEIDINKNSLKTYAFQEWKGIEHIIYNSHKNEVTYTYRNTIKGNYAIVTEPLTSFLGKLEKQEPFLQHKTSYIFILVIILSTLLIAGLIIKKYSTKTKNRNKLLYHQKENAFYFKRKRVSNLSEQEFRLLKHLVLNKDKFIPLHEINTLFTNGKEESYDTISKRRETTQSELLFKLSTVLGRPKEEIIVVQKNPNDKRLKEIKFTDDLFLVK